MLITYINHVRKHTYMFILQADFWKCDFWYFNFFFFQMFMGRYLSSLSMIYGALTDHKSLYYPNSLYICRLKEYTKRIQGWNLTYLFDLCLPMFLNIHTWYQEYARSDGSMRMVMILALGMREAARLGASSEWK